MHVFHILKNRILPYVFPVFCLGCKTEGKLLCYLCEEELYSTISPEYVWISDVQVYACMEYIKGSIFSQLLHAYKYEYITDFSYILKNIVVRAHAILPIRHMDKVVPIPLHVRRYAERGFNQVDVIAQQVSTLTESPVQDLLKRRLYTDHYSLKNKEQRVADRNAEMFICSEPQAGSATIVDDIVTTGTTLQNAVDALQEKEVAGFCLAYKK